MRRGIVAGVLVCVWTIPVMGGLMTAGKAWPDVSTPGRVEFLREESFDFYVPADDDLTIRGFMGPPVTVVCTEPGVPGFVGGGVDIEVWAVSGGPVSVTGLYAAVSFGWSGNSYWMETNRPVPLLGPDADPSAALHMSNHQGDSVSCGSLGYLRAGLISRYSVLFENTGSETAFLHMNVEHRGTLSGFSMIPEPGTAATVALTLSVLAAGCFRLSRNSRARRGWSALRSRTPNLRGLVLCLLTLSALPRPAWCGMVTYSEGIQPIAYSEQSNFVSTPRFEYQYEIAFEFEIDGLVVVDAIGDVPPGSHVVFIDQRFGQGLTVFCPPGEMGAADTSTQIEAWAVSGGPVYFYGYGTGVRFGRSWASHSQYGPPMGVLGSDRAGALRWSMGGGDSNSCALVSDFLMSWYGVSFFSTGSEPAHIHMLVEHRASLSSNYSSIPEPGSFAMSGLAAVSLAVHSYRRRRGLRIPSRGSPSPTDRRA